MNLLFSISVAITLTIFVTLSALGVGGVESRKTIIVASLISFIGFFTAIHFFDAMNVLLSL